MRHLGISFCVVAALAWCLVGGCSKEEKPATAPKKVTKPAPETPKKPMPRKTRSDYKPARRPAPSSRASAPATKSATTQSEAPVSGPMRLGETPAGERTAAGEAPARQGGASRGSMGPGARGSQPWPKIKLPDRLFSCLNCGNEFTLSGDEAQKLMSEASKKAPGKRPQILCPKCKQTTAVAAMKCEKCGATIRAPEWKPEWKDKRFPDEFIDACPKCGFSRIRENILVGLRRAKADGRLTKEREERLSPLFKKAIEDARARGEWQD